MKERERDRQKERASERARERERERDQCSNAWKITRVNLTFEKFACRIIKVPSLTQLI